MDKIADASRHAGFAAVIDHGGIVATPDRRELPSCDAGFLDRTFWKLRRVLRRGQILSGFRSREGGEEFREIEKEKEKEEEEDRDTWTAGANLNEGGEWEGGLLVESISRWIRVSLVRHCREFNGLTLASSATMQEETIRSGRKNEARMAFEFETEMGRSEEENEREGAATR